MTGLLGSKVHFWYILPFWQRSQMW